MPKFDLSERAIRIIKRALFCKKDRFMEIMREFIDEDEEDLDQNILLHANMDGDVDYIKIHVFFNKVESEDFDIISCKPEMWIGVSRADGFQFNFWSKKHDFDFNLDIDDDNDDNLSQLYDNMVETFEDGRFYKTVEVCDFCNSHYDEKTFETDGAKICCNRCYPFIQEMEDPCAICLEKGEGLWMTKKCECKGCYHKKCLKRVDKCPTCRKKCINLYV